MDNKNQKSSKSDSAPNGWKRSYWPSGIGAAVGPKADWSWKAENKVKPLRVDREISARQKRWLED